MGRKTQHIGKFVFTVKAKDLDCRQVIVEKAKDQQVNIKKGHRPKLIHDDSGAGVLGHGISRHFHSDIMYFYKVYPNAVEVYSPKFDSESQPVFDKWQLLQTVSIKKSSQQPTRSKMC